MITPTSEDIAKLEEELKELGEDDSSGGYGSPKPEKKDSTLVLFRELIKSIDSKKFANLNAVDLGKPNMSVRDQFNIAAYLDGEGLKRLGDYFRTKAEITLSTSLSYKAKLIDNIVTQIKKEQTVKEPTEQVKKTIFGKPKEAET